jgi:hypothetical protein
MGKGPHGRSVDAVRQGRARDGEAADPEGIDGF